MHLGFFVLAVDAFGAGERYTDRGKGTYHGALYGSPLWPAGMTLLGQQVYDNQRAVDYLLTRPEVDGERLGITGASGGGNQSMYAGALDERLKAIVPVCSVGNFQAYLQAACCVCEVLPGALRFTEEGDVLGLTAPRALLVMSADEDAFQFSVGEAKKSLERARSIYRLHNAIGKIEHVTFASKHDYSQPMREAMYGWMTKWLKDEGDGKPIAKPAHKVETPEELAVFAKAPRPKGFLFPPTLAAREGRKLIDRFPRQKPDHIEEWESLAVHMRSQLTKDVFGGFPNLPKANGTLGRTEMAGKVRTVPLRLQTEPGLSLSVVIQSHAAVADKQKACVLLDLEGLAVAAKSPLAHALLEKGWIVHTPDLRATGEGKPANDLIHEAVDHTSAEHADWIGRPLLGQWVFDVLCLLDWMGLQPGLDKSSFAVIGLGSAGLVALCAGGLFDDRLVSTVLTNSPVSYITEDKYSADMRMGLLAPGILKVGDIPHLAALSAPRRLIIDDGVTPQGTKFGEKALREAYAFPASIYDLYKAKSHFALGVETAAAKLVEAL
jgi:dienelactone hydrolase